MQADKTTITDLSLFHHDEEQSVFHHLNFTRTNGGREWWRQMLSNPLHDINAIQERQQTIQVIGKHLQDWPETITNGNIMVMEKYYDTVLERIPQKPDAMSAFFFRLFNAPDYSIIKYTVEQAIDFIKGMQQLYVLLKDDKLPASLRAKLERIAMLLNKPFLQQLRQESKTALPLVKVLYYGHYLRYQFKNDAFELIDIFSQLDAWYSMAKATAECKLVFPEFEQATTPHLKADGLFHLLLHTPVSYDVDLQHAQNFCFLTGANMAGKSTFIKAVGVAVYLAHIGMAVPAAHCKLSLFDGLLSNIQVVDNIIKGESYFFNEVQRIKNTIEKINDGKKWLILIDELFKGTNVQDAMKCSTSVVEGLRKMNNALFILSTHLYEIGDGLRQYPNIQFRYFETHVQDDQLIFSYQLKEGISNDRLGYLILKKEGVVNMLEKL
jgi:DNA mismatch repair ATPase MutS